ncbi:phosphatidate cytidylyltransferase [Paenarthrobacter aurescens]|uniref:Phosphatidate cytidylyltransferase n=1 Tax=Paenarthrobacter aurescens TaxID=43663 RepID=A0A4Y3NKH2_PAEAU|nr:phosphatidate cytidylyltransferase [Paenarthrobacter aurescens]UKA51272.1 phosphatidate cytidylyltransferase [Arthrobacter sp. FW305-123]MDO6143021.1 phosphatidate cytidylyltransferase [Paenarthrobacter aurescens]MDO6146866.1 phosphatidate cytidylyltransferase [Paenarthrobacter aurescens]MDO6158112.1 phosphatidate cytidylyltransferase [Paenarthrobacter aurescens]MDO6162097.1 phosphatidate cytidylyltransferase [Paenarthrobacter aurescens]
MNQAEPAPAERVPTRDTPKRVRRVRKNPTPKAGRNLPAAIGVGLAMLLAVLGGLLFLPLGFVLLTTAFAVLGVWEVFRALEAQGTRMPIVPVMVGSLVMPVSAYFGGLEGLLFTMTASSVAVLLWRSIESAAGAPRSVFAGVFTLAWIPFLISFASLSLHTASGPTPVGFWPDGIPEGAWQIASMLLLVVSNDTFGYIVGASFGKHPMAPKISPKKSWEGFAGSVGGAMVIGVLACIFLLDRPWWVGLVLAVGMVAAATAGDLAESMVKRELGVKDMSSILPGHGGVMDRLDSIVFAAPVAYVLFALLSGV